MFNTLTIRASRVRPGNTIKVAGKKYAVEAVATFHKSDDVEISFLTTPQGDRFSTLIVDKNEPIKIYK